MDTQYQIDDINASLQEIRSVVADIHSRTNKVQNTTRLDVPLNNDEQAAINYMIEYPISTVLTGTTAATAANYGVFYIANSSIRLSGVSESHTTKGTDASAVTLQIEKLTGTTAPDSGTVLLGTAIDLKGNINTVQTPLLVKTGDVILHAGDRLCLKDAGVLTAVAGVCVTIWLKPI